MTLLEDVQALRKTVEAQDALIRTLETRLTIAETEVKELRGIRKAAYWVVGLIIAGAISFGFSVLALVPG